MKLIELTQGKFAQVDDSDYDYLMKYSWRIYSHPRNTTLYAIRTVVYREKGKRKWKNTYMHQEIMKTGTCIDHADHDGLNNQRENLREATNSQNQANRKKIRKSTSSIYKGVSKVKRGKCISWVAKCKKKEEIKAKEFPTELQAAKQYNIWAVEMFGEFALLNIIG